MDFTEPPLSSLPGIEVPLMDIVAYDLKGLTGFPERCGFVEKLLADDSEIAKRYAAFVQSWLYFGLLSEFLQIRIEADSVASNVLMRSGQRKVATDAIAALLRKIPRPIQSESDRRRSLLEEAILILKNIEMNPLYQSHSSPVQVITLSIRILLSVLGTYADWRAISTTIHPLISKTLQNREWCPSQIQRIQELKNDIAGYYLIRLRRHNPLRYSHSSCPKTNCKASSTTLSKDYKSRHTHADLISCPLVHVDTEGVKAVIANGGIPLISIKTSSTGKLQLDVQAGTSRDSYVALSHVWSDGLGNPSSNALPKCQVYRLAGYLASLPNPSFRNPHHEFRFRYSFGPISLDLEKMRLAHRSPAQPMLFWMDTLCIPVSTFPNDQWTSELKKRAIDQMATIYGNSSQVLVLDSGLQEVRIGAMRGCEILANLAFSNWMGRSWTLQEGALNPNVYFQFADGALNLFDMPRPRSRESWLPNHPAKFRLMDFKDHSTSLLWAWQHRQNRHELDDSIFSVGQSFEVFTYKALYRHVMTSLHSSGHSSALPYYLSPQTPRSSISKPDALFIQRLVTVWNSLSTRTTTQAEDLPAIFSNLLDLNTYQLLTLPALNRLGAILGAGDMLPLSLLYNCGPRLRPCENHRGRWIPTLLGHFSLEEIPFMRLDSSRNLVIRAEDTHEHWRPIFLLLEARIPLSQRQIVVGTAPGVKWRLNIHREDEDCFNRDEYVNTGFIIATTSAKVQNVGHDACCVRFLPRRGKPTFEGIFDCPCTAERVVESGDLGRSEINLGDELKEWEIKIETDHESRLPVLSDRSRRGKKYRLLPR